MNIILHKTFDPHIKMGPEDVWLTFPEGTPVERIVVEIMLDGQWIADTNQQGETPDAPPVTWGIAQHGNMFYLWSGPYNHDKDPAHRWQVDTFRVEGMTL